jgi:agmatine deiminase
MPWPLYQDDQRLPASYANFYVANEIVLMPAYDPRHDDTARATLARCFPGRTVIPVDCTDLVWGLGSIHCVTQQWPA